MKLLNISLPKLLFITVLLSSFHAAKAQRLSRDLHVDLLTNQVGYLPSAVKTCVLKTSEKTAFEVVDLSSGKVVHRGTLVPKTGDFGTYASAAFSNVTREGHYYLRADTIRSFPFVIAKDVYQPVMNKIVGYFGLQRCGASATGYLSPCHLDDGIRFDNGKHQDVSGGWHDASDLRKWVSATIYGVLGLARAYELAEAAYRPAILDELRWGNQYFLKMQEPQGYVMDFVGGDLKKHSDNNRWTDNEIEKGGKDIRLVTPTAGASGQPMLVSENYDDRIIQTQPVEMTAEYNFITAQALVARITSKTDAAYAKKCLDAAKKCYDWCLQQRKDTSAEITGSALQAAIEMYRTTQSDVYRKRATELALLLQQLQSTAKEGNVSGFFYTSPGNREPHKNIWVGCQAFIGLSDLATLFPNDSHVQAWKSMIRSYADNYLLAISQKNNFRLVPWALYSNEDPGGNRKAGQYWYRYFMQPEHEWWVGINSNVASAGIGLLKAGKVLGDEQMRGYAQRQLDWVLGANPLNSSTVEGVGYNQPKHFAGSSFIPNVPVLPGAVLNGLGGNHDDMPVIGDGDWQISEYWTPMVAHTLWLMAELSHAGNIISK